MRKLLLYAVSLGFVISLITLLSNNFSYSQQTSTIKTTTSSVENIDDDDNNTYGDDMKFTSSSSQISSDSSSIQRNSLSVSAANLKKPHVLKINSPNANLQGEIKINGKVVRRLNSKQLEINLSPYLSTGKQKVEISARYTPVTAPVSIEMNSPEANISQQNSGNGTINYTLDLDVE